MQDLQRDRAAFEAAPAPARTLARTPKRPLPRAGHFPHDRLLLAGLLPKHHGHHPVLVPFTNATQTKDGNDCKQSLNDVVESGMEGPLPNRQFRHLPQPDAIIRLVGDVLAEQTDERPEGHRYLNPESSPALVCVQSLTREAQGGHRLDRGPERLSEESALTPLHRPCRGEPYSSGRATSEAVMHPTCQDHCRRCVDQDADRL